VSIRRDHSARPGHTRETIARYTGSCSRCGGPVSPGQVVLFYPATGRTYGPCCSAVMKAELDRVKEEEDRRRPDGARAGQAGLFGGGRKV
jgi:hypothetical protein